MAAAFRQMPRHCRILLRTDESDWRE